MKPSESDEGSRQNAGLMKPYYAPSQPDGSTYVCGFGRRACAFVLAAKTLVAARERRVASLAFCLGVCKNAYKEHGTETRLAKATRMIEAK